MYKAIWLHTNETQTVTFHLVVNLVHVTRDG